MLPNEDILNTELERLVASALPKLDAQSQIGLAYSAGFAAGSRPESAGTARSSVLKRSVLMASHAACALAAAWVTFAILPNDQPSIPAEPAATQTDTSTRLAHENQPSGTHNSVAPIPDGILSPRTSPSRLVEFIIKREADSQIVTPTDSETILSSRSILF